MRILDIATRLSILDEIAVAVMMILMVVRLNSINDDDECQRIERISIKKIK